MNYRVAIRRTEEYVGRTERIVADFVVEAENAKKLRARLDEIILEGEIAQIDRRFDEGEVESIDGDDDGDDESEEIESIDYEVTRIRKTNRKPSTFADEDLQRIL